MQKTTAAFSQCDHIEFHENLDEYKQPPIVILVYDNWDKILNSNSHEVYNTLLEKTDVKSTFLKVEEQDNRLTISFIDGKNDIHFSVKNLKYKKTQLDKFLEKIKPNHSIAFVLGMPNEGHEMPMLAKTNRKEGIQILSLAGIVK